MNIFARAAAALAGYKTHVANISSAAGTLLVASGLNVDPQTITDIAMNGVTTAQQAAQLGSELSGANWQQVGIGLGVALGGNLLSSLMRSLVATPGTLAVVTGVAQAVAQSGQATIKSGK